MTTSSSGSGDFDEKESNGLNYSLDENHRAKVIISAARKELNRTGGFTSLSRYLHEHITILFPGSEKPPSGVAVQTLVISGWIEELLRFLAIKTLAGDTSYPFEMGPSMPIDAAWRALMIMPSSYYFVCRALGNENVIDHNPLCTEDRADVRKKKKDLFCTVRVYALCFDQEAPKLYWPEPQKSSQDRLLNMFRNSDAEREAAASGSLYRRLANIFSNSCSVSTDGA